MTGVDLRRSVLTRLLSVFALVAVAAHAVVAPGYMIAPAEGHRLLAVSLCSGREIVLDFTMQAPERAPAPDQRDAKHKATLCAFAAAADLAAVDRTAPEIALRIAYRHEPAALTAVFAHLRVAALRPWATGPPAAV